MQGEHTATLGPGNEIKFNGIDYSNKGPMRIVSRSPFGYIAVKHPGGSYWGGIGSSRRIVRAHFMIFKVISETKTTMTLEWCLEVNLREI